MPHTHKKAICAKLLSISNKLSFDAGNTYDKSAGLRKHDLKIRFSFKKTTRRILVLKKYNALDVDLKTLLHVRFWIEIKIWRLRFWSKSFSTYQI